MHPSPYSLPALGKTQPMNRAGRGIKDEGPWRGPYTNTCARTYMNTSPCTAIV